MKKVYIIYNKDFTTREKIVKELEEEGYKHSFSDTGLGFLKEAEEVWTWGDCNNIGDFKIAQSMGKDIWVMG